MVKGISLKLTPAETVLDMTLPGAIYSMVLISRLVVFWRFVGCENFYWWTTFWM